MNTTAPKKGVESKHKTKLYRIGNLTLLQLMFLLAMLGIVATWVLRYFFG